jgi:hypothetical protein
VVGVSLDLGAFGSSSAPRCVSNVYSTTRVFRDADEVLGSILTNVEANNLTAFGQPKDPITCLMQELQLSVKVNGQSTKLTSGILSDWNVGVVLELISSINSCPRCQSLRVDLYEAVLVLGAALKYLLKVGQLDCAIKVNALIAEAFNKAKFVAVRPEYGKTVIRTYGSIFTAVQQTSVSEENILDKPGDFNIKEIKEHVKSTLSSICSVARKYNSATSKNGGPDIFGLGRYYWVNQIQEGATVESIMDYDYFSKLKKLQQNLANVQLNLSEFNVVDLGGDDGKYDNSCVLLSSSNQRFGENDYPGNRVYSIRELVCKRFWAIFKEAPERIQNNEYLSRDWSLFGAFIGRNNVVDLVFLQWLLIFMDEDIFREKSALGWQSMRMSIQAMREGYTPDRKIKDLIYYNNTHLYSPYLPIHCSAKTMMPPSHSEAVSNTKTVFTDFPYNPLWLDLIARVLGINKIQHRSS